MQTYAMRMQTPSCGLRLALLCCLLSLGVPGSALADQYRSHQSVGSAAPKSDKSAKELLKTTQDPYAKAMLMRSLAAEAAQNKDFAAAADWLQKALDQNALSAPAQAEMQQQLVALLSASGDPKTVIATLEPLYRKNPNLSAQQLVALGAAYVEVKRYADARVVLQRGVRAVQQPPVSWLKALISAQIGSHHEADAVPTLQQLLSQTPADRDAWLRLAYVQQKVGQHKDALVTLQLMERLGYLNTPDLRLRLIALSARLGDPFQAAARMLQWLQDGSLPASAAHYQSLAALWTQARERNLALRAYHQAAKLQPQAGIYRRIGQLQLELRQNAKAVQALQTARRLGDDSATVQLLLGIAQFRAGHSESALQSFASASQISGKTSGKAASKAQQWRHWLQAYSGQRRNQAEAAAPSTPSLATLTESYAGPSIQLDAQGATLQASGAQGAAAGSLLTPIGATRAGSSDGRIPPWSGGLTRPHWPSGWQPGERLKDPFPQDKPLFTVTAANLKKHAQQLAPAYLELFKKYPDYQMPVYATRRTVSYPEAIYRATQANLGRARLQGLDALTGARLGFPFPQPESGAEVMWNHRVRYRGGSFRMHSTQAVVNPGSAPQYLHENEIFYARYANIKDPVDIDQHNILFKYLALFGDPPGVDFLALVHEKANARKSQRSVWVMPPNISRLFRIPPVGYDQPFPGSGGIYFLDMVDMYNGPFNRYVWKLTGKRELLIPYNDYHLSDGRYSYDQLLGAQHFKQAAVRYELHRVWVVEASLRKGEHHVFGKRRFYVDEDSWNVVLVENYDHEGHIWRFQEGHLLQHYGAQAAFCEPVVTYDFKTGAYFVNHLTGHDAVAEFGVTDLQASDFLPAAVSVRYRN